MCTLIHKHPGLKFGGWLRQEEKKRLPKPHNAQDAAEVIKLAEAINEKAKQKAELDHSVLEKLAYTAVGEISPMAALFGGIVGQEVVKAVSGKFHPLYQWFYFDSIESLPDEALPEEEFAPQVTCTTACWAWSR